MNILHISQALTLKDKYGGAEYTDAAIMQHAASLGHIVRSFNAKGMLIDWNSKAEFPIQTNILDVVDSCDMLIICNIEWFPFDFIKSIVEKAKEKGIPFIYHPHHMTACPYIGTPATTEQLCLQKCGSLYACENSIRYNFYKWLIANSTGTICLSPKHVEMFQKIYGDEIIDMTRFFFCAPVIAPEFEVTTMLEDRPFDTVCVGGGTHQKGISNLIKYAQENPSTMIDLYGELQEDGRKLPNNLRYKGRISNSALPNMLNLYKKFVYLPHCEESYGRVVAEASLCGCKLITIPEMIGALSYDDPPTLHQISGDNGFFTFVEIARNNSIDTEFSLDVTSLEGFNPEEIVITTTTGTGNMVTLLPMIEAILNLFPDAIVRHIEEGVSREVLEYHFKDNPRFLILKSRDELPAGVANNALWIKPAVSCDNRYDSLMALYCQKRIYIQDYDWNKSDTERHLDYARALGYTGETKSPKLYTPEVPVEEMLVGFIIGYNKSNPAWAKKHWGNEKFAALATKLLQRGYGVKIFVGNEPKDMEDAEEIMSLVLDRDYSRICIQKCDDFMCYMGMLAECGFIVGNDTGFGHIATAMEIPTYMVYGPTPPSRCKPISDIARAITPSDESCIYCHKEQGNAMDSPKFLSPCDHRCMKSITVDQVLKEILR